jgi:hypothetical protein
MSVYSIVVGEFVGIKSRKRHLTFEGYVSHSMHFIVRTEEGCGTEIDVTVELEYYEVGPCVGKPSNDASKRAFMEIQDLKAGDTVLVVKETAYGIYEPKDDEYDIPCATTVLVGSAATIPFLTRYTTEHEDQIYRSCVHGTRETA